jgi:hypothetical protein
LLLVGVSALVAPFAHRCLDHSGSLRIPKETSGTLGLPPPIHPVTQLYSRTTRRRQCPRAGLTSKQVFKSRAIPNLLSCPFVFRLS